MSFTFNWPRFSDQFHYDAIQMLNTALNKGNKPPVIADKIEVVELEMGTQPPELEIRDIGELTVDQFRGIFRLTYSGDAHLVLKTKVQANPLNHKQSEIHSMTGSRGMLAAKQPLVVPMLLRLSNFKLNSYVVLVVSKQKGITLVFKTDPLQNVDISSTFDSIAVIQNFIQREIEGQLRQMFREDLPGIIHRLSQQWVKAKVEAPYLSKRPPPVVRRTFETQVPVDAVPLISSAASAKSAQLPRGQSFPLNMPQRPRSTTGVSVTGVNRHPLSRTTQQLPLPKGATPESGNNSPPDTETLDLTYGLRPEGLPTKSTFKDFSRLFTPNKGLADLAEEPSDVDDYDDQDDVGTSYDMVDWDDTFADNSPPSSVAAAPERHESVTEYETIPAVGGGTITRPRIYHSQSMIQSGSPDPSSRTSPAFAGLSRSYSNVFSPHSGFATPGLFPHQRTSPLFSTYHLPEGTISQSRSFERMNMSWSGPTSVAGPYQSRRTSGSSPFMGGGRPVTPDSLETQPSHSSSGIGRTTDASTPPSSSSAPHPHLRVPRHETDDDDDTHDKGLYMRRPPSERRLSISSSTNLNLEESLYQTGSPPHNRTAFDHDPKKIVLRPSLGSSMHQLSTLSFSNHTLSPFTRSLQHFTVRSVPPRGVTRSSVNTNKGVGPSGPVKARRKRTYRLGGGGGTTGVNGVNGATTSQSSQPTPTAPNTFHQMDPSGPSSKQPYGKGNGGIHPEFDASDMDRYFRSFDYDRDHEHDLDHDLDDAMDSVSVIVVNGGPPMGAGLSPKKAKSREPSSMHPQQNLLHPHPHPHPHIHPHPHPPPHQLHIRTNTPPLPSPPNQIRHRQSHSSLRSQPQLQPQLLQPQPQLSQPLPQQQQQLHYRFPT